jgi:hypothetical protein
MKWPEPDIRPYHYAELPPPESLREHPRASFVLDTPMMRFPEIEDKNQIIFSRVRPGSNKSGDVAKPVAAYLRKIKMVLGSQLIADRSA